MLLIYNIYRLICIAILFAAFWFASLLKPNLYYYFGTLGGYVLFSLLSLYLWYYKPIKFSQQVLLAGVIDVVVVVSLINEIGYIDSGLGILLYVYIAMLSILSPGQLAIFFAAVATCMLLSISTLKFLYNPVVDISVFFSSGVYGAGFFATALTAWYLANWVRSNEELAAERGFELANIHKLNEYIVERLQYGVIYVDSNNYVKVINKAACNFLNIDDCEKELTLKQLSPELHEKYIKFLKSKPNKNTEYVAQTTIDNPYLQVRFYSSSSPAEKPPVLIIINDMAEIAQQAQQLKLASLGFFSASIAHELRNPLGAISHACQLLGESDEIDEEDERLKELILNNCERMNKIIKNVLQISRSQKAEPEFIDLNSFLTDFRKSFSEINPCKISLKFPRGNNNFVQFDKSQLEQILVILCENAMEHGKDPEYGQALITMHFKTMAGKRMLEVCDTGPGIKNSDRKHVFDPFFSTLTTGNGMGLFIAKDLCEINQARLELLNTDSGCCFAIIFNPVNEVTL